MNLAEQTRTEYEAGRLRRAFISRRSYLFRMACAGRPSVESLNLDVCRALWRVASVKASRPSA